MMRILIPLALLISLPALAGGRVHSSGYVRKDGTYVAPHERSAPNSTKQDNWSSKPNVNPNTGEKGSKDPDAPKTK